ncbi:MAG TPA: hypothetical protein VNC50_08095 [Planctomycetia bacterium]|nr:hypothetical protein [Planctomycetia bacterium]
MRSRRAGAGPVALLHVLTALAFAGGLSISTARGVGAPPPSPPPRASGTPFLAGSHSAQLLEQPKVAADLKAPANPPLAPLLKKLREGDAAAVADAVGGDLHSRARIRADAAVRQSLGAAAAERLHQLRLRSCGLALSLRRDPALRRDMEVNAEQWAGIVQALRAALPPPPDGRDMGAAFASIRDAQDAEALRRLSPSQRAKWESLAGAAPNYPLPPPLPPAVAGGPPKPAGPVAATKESILVAALQDPAVQRELKLSEAERNRIPALAEKLRAAFQTPPDDSHGPPGAGDGVSFDRRKTKLYGIISADLSPAAATHLRQLMLQSGGVLLAIQGDADFAAKVALSPEQRRKISEMILSGKLPPPPPPVGDFEALKRSVREFRDRVDAVVLNQVLTAEQRDRWREAAGAPSEVMIFASPSPPAASAPAKPGDRNSAKSSADKTPSTPR